MHAYFGTRGTSFRSEYRYCIIGATIVVTKDSRDPPVASVVVAKSLCR